MNERLTIEHLAPYLPYWLTVLSPKKYNFFGISTDATFLIIDGFKNESISFDGMGGFYPIEHFQPILRPLSDLTKEQHIVLGRLLTNTPDKHEAFARADSEAWLRNGMQPVMSLQKCLNVTQYLFSIHADVFGLIDKRLAIDINTLTK